MIRRGFGRVGRPGLFGTIARTAVVAGTATAVSGAMINRRNQEATQQQNPAPNPTQLAATRPPTVSEQIEQLGDLKERGLLTDAEFQTQKARVLAS
ncbi:MAG: hypothetical protein JWO63_331 [Frankiales bacterium]|jgi:hypothetical protein|nr:hypothetical protein [Frankiales bacterium]